MYTKLFSSIYQGTLRGNPDGLLVFTNMLAHCDQFGVVDIHPRAIAEEVGIPIERVKATLSMLQSPDAESRTPDQEGRRLLLLDEHRDWGWQVVNYVKYRSIKNEDDRREQNRIAQEKWRNKNKNYVSKVSFDKPSVSTVSLGKPKEKQKQKHELGANAPLSAAKLPTEAISELSQEPDNSLTETPPCPTQRILAIFGERLQELPQPRRELWNGSTGAQAMRNRWKWLFSARRADGSRYAETTESGLEWFGLFFQTVAESDFLTGRSTGKWRADLAWLMKPGNFSKVIQENYTK